MTAPTDFDRVLAVAPPDFDEADVLEIAESTFAVRAGMARNLGSERDQTFLLGDGVAPPSALAVLKISNAAETPAILDMEALAVLHARQADPGLPLAVPRRVPGSGQRLVPGSEQRHDDPAARRATIRRDGQRHHVRVYDVLPGRGRTDPRVLTDAALADWGAMVARVGRALRGYFHPAASRTMLWDVQHAARTRPLLGAIRDPERRALVGRVLDRHDDVVAPAWPLLRAQIVHGDLTTDNALTDDHGRITGVVDFGDMSHSALVVDLASALDSLLNGRHGDELFRAARLILDGYQRITPLEPLELRLLGEVLAARAAVTIAISSWRAEQGLEEAAFAERYNGSVASTIETLLSIGWDEVARRFGADVPGPGDRERLTARRRATMGPALEPLTYDPPIQMAEARGVWMIDSDGRRYLDAYNNVPCVGHGHPRVTEAIARQAHRLNTNLRYLHESAIELSERLIETCPPDLDTVFFVNSGSEANDLAWRLATTFSANRGGLCSANAYHGISDAIAPLSPETWPRGRQPDHVETWPAPDSYRGRNLDPGMFDTAIEGLRSRGLAPAATILDGVLTSDGYPAVEPGLAQAWLEATHRAGGLWIADEVQGGYGRTGDGMWAFERFGIVPDIVTLGKPMGNGHPIGAVITRREIADRFAAETVFFSTFGGNPVSAAAALAVLDVLEDERVLARVVATGQALRAAIRRIARDYPVIGDVRGAGLAVGVEIVRDAVTREPDQALADALKGGLRDHGVLVGTCGASRNVLKIRPPLAFTEAEVPVFGAALEATLTDQLG